MEAYIVDYLRTAFSRSRPDRPERDIFNSLRMDDAVAKIIRELIKRNNIDPKTIGDVITGCSFQADENWLYGGRHPVILAELPVEVPGVAIDRACSSSMMAIAMGAMEVQSQNSDVVMCGGMEHMTHVPITNNPHIQPNHKIMLRPEYLKYKMNIGYNMGLTAEKLADESGITRSEMDEYALRSHKLASKANNEGYFRDEILPLDVEHDGKIVTVMEDQSIREDTDIEQLMKLNPVFKTNGVITAGNSSPLNAGASMMMIMNESQLKEQDIEPRAKIKSLSWVGVDPSVMGKGPVPASEKALKKANLKVEDVDYWEINEAFAVVALYAINELKINIDKVNIHGGSIAIGHPLGATGTRITGTLLRILEEKNAGIGVATLCVGGGQGFSIIIERN